LGILFCRHVVVLFVFVLSLGPFSVAQTTPPPGGLDPTRGVEQPQLFSSFHTPLPEQYIRTHDDSAAGIERQADPRFFRASFKLGAVPHKATLYVAGPSSVDIYVNGVLLGNFTADPLSRLSIQVVKVEVASLLHSGTNVLAIEAVRRPGGRGILRRGEVLAAKIIPQGPGILASPILTSGPLWKGTLHASEGWQRADFSDASWEPVIAIGSIEDDIDFFQWNTDAGLYEWPGYEGASPYLAHMYLPAAAILDVYAGNGKYENVDALKDQPQQDRAREFTINFPSADSPSESAPGITLDFGLEIAGRIELISDSDAPASVSIQYGESMGELKDGPYLGVNVLHLAPHGTGHGPKSAFRYARIRFLSGDKVLSFRAIHLESIYYPVRYRGSFESSDPVLNRIWEVGAYPAHLCMQDGIWDAPKRDRADWMGDIDVSGRVIDTAFADRFLMEDTMTRLIGQSPIEQHVNGIPGYSAAWLTGLATYYRHSGRNEYVDAMHGRIVELLRLMDRDFDKQNHFINHTHAWLFADWALDLNGDTPQARAITALEYVRAYRDGAWLLRALGDTKNANHFDERAKTLTQASRQTSWTGGAYGARWQTNAMAVISGVADPAQFSSIWGNALSNVGKPTWRPDVITPYYGAYVLDAMARMNHRGDALAWIREYWGGMLAEGATSFWEAYDNSWSKKNPHVDLQADNTAGYFVSLAHGWSTGPTYWLTEQVLGIRPTEPGFSRVEIRPDLVDLAWASGVEPTPSGPIKVDLQREHGLHAVIELPAGVEATVFFPVTPGTNHVLINDMRSSGTLAEDRRRLAVLLSKPGKYEIRAE